MTEKNETEDFLGKVFKELSAQQDNRRHCVILMHGFIELLVNVLIEAHCKNGKQIASSTRDYPHSAKLLILHELDILNDAQFTVLNWFRRLRNRAAHTPLFEVTPNDLIAFRGTSFENPDRFAVLCVDIFSDIWNQHLHLFVPKFSSSAIHGEKDNVDLDSQFLQHSRSLARTQHLIAHVRVQDPSLSLIEFRYDRYPEAERIVFENQSYARLKWQALRKSNDYGKTGYSIASELAVHLSTYADCAVALLAPLREIDEAQGPAVWKLLKQEIQGEHELIEYVRTREKPVQGRVYPHFRFLKHLNDPKLQLLLKDFVGNVRAGDKFFPVAIHYDYLFLMPGTFAIRYDEKEGPIPFAKVRPWTFEDLSAFSQIDDWQI